MVDDDKNIPKDVSLEVTSLLENEAELLEHSSEEESADRDAIVCVDQQEGAKQGYERQLERAHDPLMDPKSEKEVNWSHALFDYLVERVNHYNKRKKEAEKTRKAKFQKQEGKHQHELEIFAFLRALGKGGTTNQRGQNNNGGNGRGR
jgi:hypothetical protein